ncbi:hypothetical protein ABT173_44890 [Streptomyces sp. NPDC001795]|uniref:hypothetical protein n=1 Tax=unclassified Streptomyces TaxID=2593676 RepID=UPI003318F465
MKKLMRRIATTGVSAALVGGALLAASGSATAATQQVNAHTPARVAVVERQGAHTHPDPWVAGQLAMLDPWIADQLAIFEATGNPVHQYSVNDWHHVVRAHADIPYEGPRR